MNNLIFSEPLSLESSSFAPIQPHFSVNHSPRDLIGDTGIFKMSAKYALREPQFEQGKADKPRTENLDPKDSWEKGSEILFGQVYEIINISGDGLQMKVRLGGYGTEGWIELHQHTPIPRDDFEALAGKSHPMLASRTGFLESQGQSSRVIPLFMGASLPGLDATSGSLKIGDEQFRLVGGIPTQGWLRNSLANFQAILTQTLGMPYEWGGKGGSVDCSGHISVVFSFFGLKLPHSSKQQSTKGSPVQMNQLVSGDIVAYGPDDRPAAVNHVGIGWRDSSGTKLIHASQKVQVNTLDPEGRFNPARSVSVRAIRRLIDFVLD